MEVYFADMTDYSQGFTRGTWINVQGLTPDQIREQLNLFLAAGTSPGPHEEWGIFGTHGFGSLHIDQYTSLEYLARIVEGLDRFGSAFGQWISMGNDPDQNVFQARLKGFFESEEDFAQQYPPFAHVPQHLENYIDWEAVARDMFINDYYSFTVDTLSQVGAIAVVARR